MESKNQEQEELKSRADNVDSGTSSGNPLDIEPLATNKANIKQRPIMECGTIPTHPSSVLFCGKSGSGKTNLLLTLLKKEMYYKGYFDIIFIFSQTAGAGGDDLYQRHIPEVPKEHFFKPDKEGLKALDHIMKVQEKMVKEKGLDKTPKILIIFDDIAHARKFLASRQYLLLHIANRHFNISTYSLTQSYVKIPRSCRCQVNAVIFFHGCTNTEKLRLADEHTPDNHTSKEFISIIDYAIHEKYHFLFINKCWGVQNERYRKNLGEILELSK